MKLSVIIPARNAARDLPHLLRALLPQILGEDECIVVDDASSDNTGKVAHEYAISVFALATRSGPAAARNLGAKHATGDVLVFLDSDVVPHDGLLDQIREQMNRQPELSALIGSYDTNPLVESTVSRFRNLLHCYTHHHGNRNASTFWAGCGAVRRAAFESVGGYDALQFREPSVEDIELGLRLKRAGHNILLNPLFLVQHRKAWSLWTMLRTDLMQRAIPWSRLILESGSMPLDLNLKRTQRVCGGAIAVAYLLLLLMPWVGPLVSGVGILILLTIVIALNTHFYGFLARHGGWWFALRSIPLHLLYFSCGDLGYAIAYGQFYFKPRSKPKDTTSERA